MAKGRKSIPTKLYYLKGGTEKSHQAKDARDQEPMPPEKMPTCPKHLDQIARREWKRTGKILQAVGLMTDLDRAVFAGYCQAWSDWVRACVELAKVGPIYAGKDGIPKHNPWLRVKREADEAWSKKAVLLGLAPSIRGSMKVQKPKPKSKVESFKARKNDTKT